MCVCQIGLDILAAYGKQYRSIPLAKAVCLPSRIEFPEKLNCTSQEGKMSYPLKYLTKFQTDTFPQKFWTDITLGRLAIHNAFDKYYHSCSVFCVLKQEE